MARVVIAHDYLTQTGGAERVVASLLQIFPSARIVTSVYSPRTTFPVFGTVPVETLLPARRFHDVDVRLLFPLLAPAFSLRVIRDADLVICSSSGWAHGIRTRAPKVVYCHTPARWLYETSDYSIGLPRGAFAALRFLRPALRAWDRKAASSADLYIANSTTVQARIARAYSGRQSLVIHPPALLDPSGPHDPVAVPFKRFLLTVSRARGYKNTLILEKAVRAADLQLVVVGTASRMADTNVIHVGRITDPQLRWLYSRCDALLAGSFEDFGLTPVEAMSFGKPVIALRAGGYLDSVHDGVSGTFFDTVDPRSVRQALEHFAVSQFDSRTIRQYSERFSPSTFASSLRAAIAPLLRTD